MLLKMIMIERSQSYKTKKPVSNRFFSFCSSKLYRLLCFFRPQRTKTSCTSLKRIGFER
jgi:hypothetical protein